MEKSQVKSKFYFSFAFHFPLFYLPGFYFFISLDFIHPKFILIYISSQSEVNYLCIQLSNIFYLILPILYNLLFSG